MVMLHGGRCLMRHVMLSHQNVVAISQWLERLTGDQKIAGSIPVWGSETCVSNRVYTCV